MLAPAGGLRTGDDRAVVLARPLLCQFLRGGAVLVPPQAASNAAAAAPTVARRASRRDNNAGTCEPGFTVRILAVLSPSPYLATIA